MDKDEMVRREMKSSGYVLATARECDIIDLASLLLVVFLATSRRCVNGLLTFAMRVRSIAIAMVS